MAEVLTVLRIDIARDHADAERDAARMRVLVDEAGPALVAPTAAGASGLVAAFGWASDAATAALRLAGGLPAEARARIALSTGEVELGTGDVEGPARDRADALAELAGEAPVLLANSTAMMVHHTLPPGIELVDRGVVAAGPQPGERVYELRVVHAAAGRPVDDAGASNLGWARRAAARLVVGRDDAVERLEAAWARALAGDHQVAVVSGDPGIGKTTVAAELARRVHAGGGTVLYGRWDEESLAPYQAVREALGTYAAACPRPLLRADLAAHADELARLLPDLGARIGGLRPPLVDDPDAERLRLFDGVGAWLGAVARRHPVLAVLDDLQWADRSSLLLLRHLLDTPPEGGPVLVLVTLRDGEVEGTGPLHTLASCGGDGVERIRLAGLRAADVAELVAQALCRPLRDDEVAVCAGLTEETAGNPLLVHEILAGLDPDDPDGALLAARDRLPERVHDVVRWRLSRLEPAVAGVLAVASLIGEEFGLDVLAAAAELRPLELRHHLGRAARAGVVRDVGERRAGFTHAVVRRALQDDVGAAEARRLHRRIAETLECRGGDGGPAPAAEIAHHWLHAADADTAATAVRWARAAADQARRETAFEGAAWLLTRASDVHDRFRADGDSDADERACELRLELAEAHDRAGEFVARDRRHLEAAELARRLDRADHLARAARGYGGRLPAAPPPNPTARRLLEEALARLPAADSRARALTLARLAHVLHFSAPYRERSALAAEAEAMARRLDAPVVLASVLCSRVLALDGPDDVEDHLEVGTEVMRIGERTADGDLVLQGARARIQSLFTVGAHDAARDLAASFTNLADTVRHPDHLRLAAMWQTMWATLEGRFDDAVAQSDRLRQRLETAGHSQVLTIWFAQNFMIRWLRGGLAGLMPVVDSGLALDPTALNWWALKAWALAASGDRAGAAELLAARPLSDLAGLDHNYTWQMTAVGTGTAAAAVGDQAWAAASHAALAPYSGRNCVMGWVAYLGAVDHHLGVLDAVLGRLDAAADHLGAALDRHRVIDARPWVALSAAWLAQTLAERDGRGDAERAATLAAESSDLASELGLAAVPPAGISG